MGKVIAIYERVYRAEIEVELDMPQEEIDAIEEDTPQANELQAIVFQKDQETDLSSQIEWKDSCLEDEFIRALVSPTIHREVWINYDLTYNA